MESDYANELMARVGLDTTEWKKGVTDLKHGVKSIETNFQAAAALMDDWSNNSDGLKMRVKTLNDELTLQKRALEFLKRAYEEQVAATGANSSAAKSIAKQMYSMRNEINRTKASIEKYSQAEDEATKKAKELIKQMEESGQKIAAVGDKISSVGNKMTVGITTPIIAAGTAIYKYSSDLTEAENKTEATFGFMSSKVKEWAQDSLDAFGMAKSTAYDAVSLYGDMATSMGLGKSAAADMSMSLVELSADLSSFKNVSLEQSQNALKGIFTGETESLKNLGIVMTETQLKSYAMSKGIEKNYEDLTQAEKVQLRYQYVLESSSNALGDYSRTSGEAAGQVRKLPEALKELASSFRDNVEPAITPIITSVNNAIVAFGKLGDGTKETVVKIGLVAAAVGPLVTVTGKAVTIFGKAKSAIAKHRAELLKKTAATVADTVAEGAHSEALEKTADSATDAAASAAGASKGIKGIGTAASAAVPYITILVALLTAFAAIENKVRNDKIEAIEEEYEAKIKTSNEIYDTAIQKVEEELEAYEDAQNQKIASAEEYYDTQIDLLDENLDAIKKAIEKEQDLYKKAHKERLEQLEAEKELKLSNIDIEENAQVAAIQKQIDALNALTEADEKAEKERENQKKLTELQNAIRDAETYAEKVDAENEYNEFLHELELERAKEQRQLQIEELENQIETIEKESEAKRDQVNEEYEAAVELENQKYEIAEQGFSDRLEALDGYIESETARLEAAREEELAILQKRTSDYTTELQNRIDALRNSKEEEEAILQEEKETQVDEAKGPIENFFYGLTEMKKFSDSIHGKSSGNLFMPGNSSGTNFWRGGLTRINEEGGEILNLPRGTQIIPHDVSMEMARAAGAQAVNNNTTTNNSTTNNSYNYGARQQVNVFQVGNRTVAKAIVPAASVLMSDNIYGRRRSGGEIKRI